MRLSPRAYNEPILPTPDLAEFAHRVLDDRARFQLVDHATGKARDLPPEVYDILQRVAAAVLANQAISVIPTNLELTTNQAADLLNVSRSYVIGLVTSGELPFRMVGTHRRIPLDAVMALQSRMAARATAGLDALARIDQDLGLDD